MAAAGGSFGAVAGGTCGDQHYCGGRFGAQALSTWEAMANWPLSIVSESSRPGVVEVLRNFHGRDWTEDQGLFDDWPGAANNCSTRLVETRETVTRAHCHPFLLQRSQHACGTNGGFLSQLSPLNLLTVGVGIEFLEAPKEHSLSNFGMSSPWLPC